MHKALRTAITGLALVAFVAAQLLPGAFVPDVPGTDPQWHAALYFGFALFLWVQIPAPPPQRAILIVAVGFVVGILMELFQAEIPGRNPDKGDAIADLVGVCAAVLAALVGTATAKPKAQDEAQDPLPEDMESQAD